jgi:hypothetical protein
MLSSLDTAGFEWPISGNDVFRRMLPCLHRLWSIQVFSRENDHGDRERPGLCADACILSLSRMLSSKDGISDTLRSGDIHGQASLLSVLPFSSMVSDVIGRKVTWEKKNPTILHRQGRTTPDVQPFVDSGPLGGLLSRGMIAQTAALASLEVRYARGHLP